MTFIHNQPEEFATTAIAGYSSIYARTARAVTGGVVRATATPENKVAVVVGGGAGHYPAFAGFVGPGLADAAVAGDVFASPSTHNVAHVCRLAHRGGAVIQQVAIEHLYPRIARSSDIGAGAVHVAKGAIGQLRDRGDAHGIPAKAAPAIGVIGQLPRCHRYPSSRERAVGVGPRPSGFCRPPLTVTVSLSANSSSVNIISAYHC